MRPWLASAVASSLVCCTTFAQQAVPAAAPVQASTPVQSSSPMQPAVAAAGPGRAPAPNTLLDGTPVKLRLAQNLTSATAKAGQQVAFEAVEETDVEGVAVIPKFAKALATVTDAAPKRSMGRGGKLDVNIDSIRLIDGEKLQLRATQEGKGSGHIGVMTGAMVATAIVFFPAAPLFLFMKGKDIVIPEGTVVTAFVEGDMKLDMNKMVPPDVARFVADQKAEAANHASIEISANVVGCDIEVDGAFMGNTPSTVVVKPGRHSIAVKKKGYTDWNRTMEVSGDGAHLAAELDAVTAETKLADPAAAAPPPPVSGPPAPPPPPAPPL